jgi:HSP20 family protein
MKSSLMPLEQELTFDSIHRELNNFLRDTFMESVFSSPTQLRKLSTFRPAIEVKQNEKEYNVKVQLPGVNKEDIKIDLESDHITITAETKEEKKTTTGEGKEEEKVHTSEFRYGKYVRTIGFDNPIKADTSNAEYQNGILHITLPKQKIEKTHAKRLTIK